MGRSNSSQRWLQRQAQDHYVQRAQQAGYRSRAAYKLLQLNEKDRFLRPGQTIVDLGAAPGGWLQVAADVAGPGSTLIGLDRLPIDPIPGTTLIQGDFHDATTVQQLADTLAGRRPDLVISDMAPNISGVMAVDQPRAMYLCELALAFCQEHLTTGGHAVIKLFQGEGFDAFLQTVRTCFRQAKLRKPDASRARSRELYLVAKHYHPTC
ncbi:MAG: RlmE family RNA methyltransferase [Pseudomonadota bacterium]